MLVEFRVKNFKSIRDEQIFSMVAGHDETLCGSHVIAGKENIFPDLLKSAAIYGANASGKSNLIEAFNAFRTLLKSENPHVRMDSIVPSFKFFGDTQESGSEFEVTVVEDGIRYQYGVSFQNNVVDEEWLLVYRTKKPQKWFHRKRIDSMPDQYDYHISSYLKGPKEEWKKLTPPNGLFLTRAIFFNSTQLEDVYHKVLKNLNPLLDAEIGYRDKIDRLRDADTRKKILEFLRAADIDIEDLYFLINMRLYSSLAKPDQDHIQETSELIFVHECGGVKAEFSENEESAGTLRLLALAFYVLDALSNGDVVIIDELERSLHPKLVRHIVEMFNLEHNTAGAQLIFTTHNPLLLDRDILRRDQIWFIEKGKDGASSLYPLTDFSPRKEDSFLRKYLSGAYGAVPYLTNFSVDGDNADAAE